MKKPITIIVCFLFTCCRAQPPAIIAKACSTSNLKKNLYYLASDNREGRMMASHGDTLASLFVAGEFKKANLLAADHIKVNTDGSFADSLQQPVILKNQVSSFSADSVITIK